MAERYSEHELCIGKQSYDSKAIALKVVKNRRSMGKAVDAYKCQHCGDWHTGRRNPHRRTR